MALPNEEDWARWTPVLERKLKRVIRTRGLAGLNADIQEAAKRLMCYDKEVNRWMLRYKMNFQENIKFGNRIAELARHAMMEQILLERT